jgi:hypothetical protein
MDFFCKNTDNGVKTNSIIINGKCLNKVSQKLVDNEQVFINYGADQIAEDGAFINNTYFNPLFKKDSSPTIPYTSGNQYINRSKDNQ